MNAVSDNLQLEQLTQRIGLDLFRRVRAASPLPFSLAWWQEQSLKFFMQDEWLKVQAFRFIDVLPTMSGPAEIARHIHEYFAREPYPGHRSTCRGGSGQSAALAELAPYRLPSLGELVTAYTRFQRFDSLHARFMSMCAWNASIFMAHRFLAGSNTYEAEQTIQRLRRQKLAFTVDVLGEAALSAREAEHYHETYLELLSELPLQARSWQPIKLVDMADGHAIPRVNVSVKLTAIYPGLDPIAPQRCKRLAKERLRPLLRRAMEHGTHLHVDMEHYAIKDLTLEIVRELMSEDEFRDYPHFGVVLQAYLRDGDRDAHEMVEWAKRRGTPFWIRLVKGAYWDSETVWAKQSGWPCPVWTRKWQSDACYERMTRILLENWRHTPSAFGTHNIRSIAHAMAVKQSLGVPDAAFEIQMLYGMGDPIKQAIVGTNHRCRIYTPYGELLPGMAYLIRRLLENTANESFLRHSGESGVAPEQLLVNPEKLGASAPPEQEPVVIRFEGIQPLDETFRNAPNSDLGRAECRKQLEEALIESRARFGREYPLLIGGQATAGEGWRESRNPSNPDEIVGKVAVATPELADRAAREARSAFLNWRETPALERAAVLDRAATLLECQRYSLAATLIHEVGKTWREADAEVSEAIDYLAYYALEMRRIDEHPRRRDVAGETNEYRYSPRGVTVVLGTWSFPLALLAGQTAAAVVTGNSVVLKPASGAGITAARLVELFVEAGLPPEALTYLPGPGETVGAALVRHPLVSTIAGTGSRETGLRVHRQAVETTGPGPTLKRVLFEMGGKNATIVDSDADLDEAIKGVLTSAFAFAGQKCTAASRCIVVGDLYSRFVERLIESAGSISVGSAEEPATFVPPLLDEAAYQRVRGFIALGKAEATCGLEYDVSKLAGGKARFIGPTIFVDVPPSARIAQEEIFGPVLSVLKAADIHEAIAIFNGTDYALTGGIFSRSPANIDEARRLCECGNFYVNRRVSGSRVDLQPFGGLKLSGSGVKIGGPDYLVQFCQARTVTENTLRRGFAPSDEVAEVLR